MLRRKKMKTFAIKAQLVVFLSFFAFYLSFIDKDSRFLLALLVAVASTAAIDTAFTLLKQKKFSITSSSLISGLIIGFVLSSDLPLWTIALASLIAIASKHLINFKGRHVYNPAALGIFAVIISLDASTQWRGTYFWQALVPAGLYFSYKIRKLEVIVSYFVAGFALFGAQALMQGVSLSNVFGYFSYFYIFIMVIEPKTTPTNLLGKVIFGVMLAGLIFVLTGAAVRFDVELASLLAMNSATPLLNRLNIAKKGG